MRTWRRLACGQRPNQDKVQLLVVGRPPGRGAAAPPAAAGPYKVVTRAETLGVWFSNEPFTKEELRAFWEERLGRVYDRYHKLCRLRLSAFGRSYGAAGYGISRLLYHMEFMGLPPNDLLDQLIQRTARMVDTGTMPAEGSGGRYFTGLPHATLPGPPGLGGFGMLRLREHVQARHAWWALRLVTAPMRTDPAPTWVHAASYLVRHTCPNGTTMALLTSAPKEALFTRRPRTFGTGTTTVMLPSITHLDCPYPVWRGAVSLQNEPFKRLCAAMHPLPHACRRQRDMPVLGEWVRHAPLWGNPLLKVTHTSLFPEEHFAEYACPFVAGRADVATVGDLMGLDTPLVGPLGPQLTGRARVIAKQAQRMWTAVPATWSRFLQPAPAVAGDALAAARSDAHLRILSPLHLPLGFPAAPSLTNAQRHACHTHLHKLYPAVRVCPKITVKQLTQLQPDEGLAARWARLAAFLQEAAAPPQVSVAQHLEKLDAVWRLPWHNYHKEVLWRLSLDGFAMVDGARFHQRDGGARSCPCGRGLVSRIHHFWRCPAAQSVVAAIRSALPPAAAQQLTRHHVWLVRAPPGVHGGVWQVVSLAALSAMHRAWLAIQGPRMRPDDPRRATVASPAVRYERACLAVVEWFWSALRDFVWLNPEPPKSWSSYGRVPLSHPFLQRDARRQLCVSPRPAAPSGSGSQG